MFTTHGKLIKLYPLQKAREEDKSNYSSHFLFAWMMLLVEHLLKR